MSAETELIQKIQGLKQIRPRKDWVVLTKSQILGEEKISPVFGFGYPISAIQTFFQIRYLKPAFATISCFALFISAFVVSQNSLPGEFLFSLKKISEKTQVVFVSEEEKPAFQIKLANERLKELTQINESNQVEKLDLAINEVQTSFVQISQNLKEEPEKVSKTMVEQTQKLKEAKQEIEKTLATKIVTEEAEQEFEGALLSFYKTQAEMLVLDLENRTLNETQEQMLNGAKQDIEKGDYEKALFENLLPLSYSQEQD
ncbi:DUF5667 domain-containing protein [Patescibacteria group bacterium]